MKRFKITFPRKIANYLAIASLAIVGAGGAAYILHNNDLDAQLRMNQAGVVDADYGPRILWDNFVHEGGGNSGDWFRYLNRIEKLNGKKPHEFKMGDRVLLLDLPDHETGKPDGKVLPDNYPR